jgi:hypothetical protein
MIWQGIITIVTAILMAIITLFPVADPLVTARLTNGLAPFKNALATADWLFPVSDFFAIISIVIGIELTILVIKLIHWIVKNISAGLVK